MNTYKSLKSMVKIICLGVLFAFALCSCNKTGKASYNPKDLIILKDSVTNLYYYADTNFRRVGELYTKAYAFQDKHAIVMYDSTYYIIDENFKIVSGAIKAKYPQLKNDILVYSKNDSVVCYVNFKKNITKEFKANSAFNWNNKAIIVRYKTRIKDFSGTYYKDYRLLYSLDKEEIVQRDLEECLPIASPFNKMKEDILESITGAIALNYLYAKNAGKAYIVDTNLTFTNYYNAEYIFAPRDGFWPFIRDNKIGLMNMDFSLFLDAQFYHYGEFYIHETKENEHYNYHFDDSRALNFPRGFNWPIYYKHFVSMSDSNNSYILDTKNKSITKCQYTIIDELRGNLFCAYDGKQYFIIDYKGEKISNKSWKYYDNFEGEITVSDNLDFRGAKDIYTQIPHLTLKNLKPDDYYDKELMHSGYYKIWWDEYIGVLDKNDSIIIPLSESSIWDFENPNITMAYWERENRSEIRSTKTKEVLKVGNCGIVATYDKYFALLYKDKADIYDNYFHKILSVPCDELKFLRSNIIEVNFKGKSRYIKL